MIFGEVLALFAILGALGVGSTMVLSWIGVLSRDTEEKRKRKLKMLDDLNKALSSRDYRQHRQPRSRQADMLDLKENAAIKEHVKERRDELFIESNT